MAFSIVIIVLLATVATVALGQTKTADAAPKCQMNGQSYDVGSMFDGPDAFYYCKRDGASGTKSEAIGCINDGQRVYDLALYQKGDNVFRCRAGDTSVTSDLWGCAMKNADGSYTQKSVACTWDITIGADTFVQCCIAKGGTAVITQLYCLYPYRGGRIQINEGCFRVFPDSDGGKAVGCTRNSDGISLSMTKWAAKDSTSAAAAPQASGLHECALDSRK